MSELDKQKETVHNAINTLFDIAKVQKAEIDLLNVDIANKQSEINELKEKIEKTCKWSSDEDLNWWTQCGNGFVFGDDPHPTSHNFKHCCYCGGVLNRNTMFEWHCVCWIYCRRMDQVMTIEEIRKNATKGADVYRIENGVVEYAVSRTYIDWNTGKKVKMLPFGWNWL